MKSIILLYIILLNIYIINCSNAAYDYDVKSAPPIGAHLDISETTVFLDGYYFEVRDTSDPIDAKNFTAQINRYGYNSKEKWWFYQQDNATYIVNATDAYLLFTTTNPPQCHKVANYNYTFYVEQLKYMRRIGSVKMNIDGERMKRQLDKAYKDYPIVGEDGCKDIDGTIFDIYIGMYQDPWAPGSISGCQNQILPSMIYSSRYAKAVYNQTLINSLNDPEFLPFLEYTSPSPASFRNIDQSAGYGIKVYDNVPVDIYSLIDEYCQTNVYDYCTDYYNLQCILPNEVQYSCGKVGKNQKNY